MLYTSQPTCQLILPKRNAQDSNTIEKVEKCYPPKKCLREIRYGQQSRSMDTIESTHTCTEKGVQFLAGWLAICCVSTTLTASIIDVLDIDGEKLTFGWFDHQ